ncbi:hypothetical protein E2562_018349 [Oryza meyeriana var. granulata]|uniref:KIB1-4 beta-propeller domain-containing protein n=1 Tax=Oryza meyeriana var. granulata TaxID=110450 RepID=A0A6G1D6Y4_9ORYZ|nr:hypothetical protein E2562_018349 [Oryza meyeriana var. granulata]
MQLPGDTSKIRRPWCDWAALPGGLVEHIADLILDDDLPGFVRFRSACRPWKDATPDPAALGPQINRRFHPRRWIMREDGAVTLRRFLNIDTRKIVEVDLPLLADHPRRDHHRRASPQPAHPSRRRPPVGEGAAAGRRHVVQPVPGGTHGDCLRLRGQIPYHRDVFRQINKLAVAKPGDAHWTLVGDHQSPLLSTFTFQGRFYCIDNQRILKVVNTADELPPLPVLVAELNRRLHSFNMVDNGGKLMVVCMWRPSRARRDRPVRGGRGGRDAALYDLDGGAVFIGDLDALLLPIMHT